MTQHTGILVNSGALMTGSKKLFVSSALGVSCEIKRKIDDFFFATWRPIGVRLI